MAGIHGTADGNKKSSGSQHFYTMASFTDKTLKLYLRLFSRCSQRHWQGSSRPTSRTGSMREFLLLRAVRPLKPHYSKNLDDLTVK